MKFTTTISSLVAIVILATVWVGTPARADNAPGVTYQTVEIEGVEIFYREAGDPQKPTLLLLHGFPTSSHMFRDLLAELSDEYHLVAPDYPGYGFSSMPSVDEFDYSFDNVARLIGKHLAGRTRHLRSVPCSNGHWAIPETYDRIGQPFRLCYGLWSAPPRPWSVDV